jgi:hypothetical protein
MPTITARYGGELAERSNLQAAYGGQPMAIGAAGQLLHGDVQPHALTPARLAVLLSSKSAATFSTTDAGLEAWPAAKSHAV